jgi:hypothetical protein
VKQSERDDGQAPLEPCPSWPQSPRWRSEPTQLGENERQDEDDRQPESDHRAVLVAGRKDFIR